MEYIQDIIAKVRAKSRMSMEEVALSSGYTKATVHNIEKGKRSGNFNTINDIINALGYEIKIVKKGIFKNEIIEWTQELPEAMHPDQEEDETMVEEYGRPLETDDNYLIMGEDGRIYSSRLYLFEDGKIEMDGYYNIKPIAWMEIARKED